MAQLYESLLARIADDHVTWDLAKKLGILARDELHDTGGAKTAFSRASHANPEDVELYFWLAELRDAEQMKQVCLVA